jgi:hypothetical protein
MIGTGNYGVGYNPNYQAVSDGLGGILITWVDMHGEQFDAGSYDDILSQRVGPSGETVWSPGGLRVARSSRTNTSPRIVADGSGGAIIFWEQDRRNSSSGYLESDLYAQRIDSSGNSRWAGDGVLVCTAVEEDTSAGGKSVVAVTDGSEGAMVFFKRSRYFGSKGWLSNLNGQRINGDGRIMWSDNGVPVSQGYSIGLAGIHVAPDGSGGARVAWVTATSRLLLQGVDSSGSTLWTRGGVSIARPKDHRTVNEISMQRDGSGGVVISWQHYHGGMFDLFTQRVDRGGKPMWEAGGIDLGTRDDPRRMMANNLYLANGIPGPALIIMWYYPSYASSSPRFSTVRISTTDVSFAEYPYALNLDSPRDIAIALILAAGIVSSVAYLVFRFRKSLRKDNRLRWVGILFLVAADISVVFSVLARQRLALDVAVVSLILLAISGVVWKSPTIGGITAVTTAPLLLLLVAFMNGNYPFGRADWTYSLFAIGLLAVGGMLSVLWARQRKTARALGYPELAVASVAIGSLALLAVAAFTFIAVASLAQSFATFLGGRGGGEALPTSDLVRNPQVLLFLLLFAFNSAGLVCGIVGLKSRQRGAGIAGVVVCSLALIPTALMGVSEYAWLLGILT